MNSVLLNNIRDKIADIRDILLVPIKRKYTPDSYIHEGLRDVEGLLNSSISELFKYIKRVKELENRNIK